MFVENKFYVGLRDITPLKQLKNTSLLSYLEDVACMHSEIAGYGVSNMDNIKRTWILLSWKIEIKKRPKFNDFLKVKTWSRLIEKFYAFRDFKIFNQNEELIAIATSKWVFVDIEKDKLVKISDDISNIYEPEEESVFEEIDLPRFKEPSNYINKIDYKITKNMIDINNHLHNIYYMDIVREILPINIEEPNKFEITYKKEIKFGETVKALYSKIDDYHYVTIKDESENIIHAIIRLRN